MATYDPSKIKNVVLLGHQGSGKTTLAETMLFEAGAIARRGHIEEGNTTCDYSELERQRQGSVFATLCNLDWRGYKLNVIDTPGSDDFIAETCSALRVADTGIMLLNAQFGVEVGCDNQMEYVRHYATPMIFAVNQLDHEKADFEFTVEQAKERYGSHLTVVQYPLNPGPGFNAIIDVLKMTMYLFPGDGGKPEKRPIPDDQKDRADKLHNDLIESIAENDEGLMELYFDKGSLDEDEMRQGLRIAMLKGELYPLFCLSAKHNMGSGRLMGFIDNVAPSALDSHLPPLRQGAPLPLRAEGPAVAFVYKTISEPHLGELAFFKIYSGKLEAGDELMNASTGSHERLNQIFVMQGHERKPVQSLSAGDIGATVKLKQTTTNNTLHSRGTVIEFEPIQYPEPRIRAALETIHSGDEERLAQALGHIYDEDPSLRIEHSTELKQLIIHGQGELHLQTIKWKLENLYKVEVNFVQPKIPYRETITTQVNTNYRHKKQSGGAGQFAEVHMRVEPWYDGMPAPADLTVRSTEEVKLAWGGKLVLNNCIVGGAIDIKYMNAILKGIMEKMQNGPLTGSYVRDVRVSIYDGKMHAVDSNDMAFKTAAMMAFRQAFREANPQLLEPIYNVTVTCPDEMMGDIMSDLQTRRAIIMGIEGDGHNQIIKARVPLSEMYKYSSTLRSISHGRAKHHREFAEYAPLPAERQHQLIAAHSSQLQDA